MILSPPFLPEPQTETDAQFVERAMPGGAAGDGGFPLSFDLNWHGGLHVTSPPGPPARGVPTALPVRAIADGTVAFVRKPTAVSAAPDHPLRHRGGWTDDGCVVIRHETEIGASPEGNPTTVVFFSIYMHLRAIPAAVAKDRPVFRKDPIGTAGRIYGVEHRIHFEIICDDANVKRLAGRSNTFLSVTADGRRDAVFGATWFLLLVDTQFLASEPEAGKPAPAVVHTNDAAIFVRIELRDGDAVIQSFHLDGRPVDDERRDAGFEYTMFAKATEAYPRSPSAGYELLRFGRVLGPDALQPADAPHFRQVHFAPGSTGWVNLNAARVRRFSDADLPHWDSWWMLVDGSSSTDSRCKEPSVLELLDADNDWKVPPDEATRSLNDPDRQRRLARKICKHQTEWDATNFDARYGWLRTDPGVKATADELKRLKAHVTALAFWPAAALGIPAVHWHFHPRLFILHFRKCGWFSLSELTQLMPRVPTGVAGNQEIPFNTARDRFRPRYLELNRVLRRYNLLNVQRQTHFLAQTYIEVALWATMREFGRARPRADGTFAVATMEFYAAFYGRGIMQLTWAGNYIGYGEFRRIADVAAGHVYTDDRITHTSTHYLWDPRDRAGNIVGTPVVWFPRYDPELVADDPAAACDSGGFYWISKHTGGARTNININRVADRAFDTASVGRVSVLVNGGGFGFVERQRWAKYVFRYRSDSTEVTPTETFNARHGGTTHSVTVDYKAQRP